MAEFIEFWTPVGRMLGGNVFEAKTRTDFTTGKPKLNEQGEETEQFLVTLAIPKAGGEFERQMLPFLQQAAARDWTGGQAGLPTFAWKFADGDSTLPDRKGKRWCDKPGYPGHWVARLSTSFDFPVVAQDGVKFLTDPKSVLPGYYVRAFVSVKGNGQAGNPGLYLNIRMLQLVAYGEVINVGIDMQAAMRAAPAISALPQGASLTPQAGAVPVGHQPPPLAAAQTVVAPAAQPWPPAGWTPYPNQPGLFYMGQEVLNEQQLRARYAAPNPAVLSAGLPPIPGR